MSDLIVRPEREPQPDLPSGYYVCVGEVRGFDHGDLVYLLEAGVEQVEIVSGERRFSMDRADFAATFDLAPDGAALRQAQITELMAANANPTQLAVVNPHLGETGELQGVELMDPSRSSAIETKKTMASLRNTAARMRTDMETRQAQIKALAEEQAIILRAQVTALAEVLSKAEEAVWTINLYLGSNEEIVRLAEGEPAPLEEPITVRQLVLYMDEECAVAAEAGGIDARSVEEFDTWLTSDPAHRAQVFPEAKGIVALKPRRSKKEYGDPWANKALNEANRKTYFLLRNGDNLFRMWTDYEVDERLVPKTSEFVDLFVKRQYNWKTHRDDVINLRPGSEPFMRAEKSADSVKRHYMRAALILQGLLDRTPVFRPLPEAKIDVTKQEAYEGPIRVILDADLMLSDGVERFADWVKRINAALEPGMRIIGSFNNWEHGLRHYDYEKRYGNERISPNGASYPDSGVIHTLDSRRGDGFVFYYERTGEWRDYAKRASCVVYRGDEFILNFDAASVEEMEYYLSSRLDRHNYLYMIPILKRAIVLKRAEEEAEEPFRLLLTSQIVAEHGADVSNAAAAVPELVRWWKFKNRTHRALSADDAKALRMIVAEYELRAAQTAERTKRATQLNKVRDAILAAEPDALLVAHKAGAEYVALLPANDDNIFVHEQIWTAKGRKSERAWRTVDSRYQRWQILHTSERWDGWKVGASRNEHLTDDERTELIAAGWLALADRIKLRWNRPDFDAVPLVAAANGSGALELFYVDSVAAKPTELLLSSAIDEPDLGNARIKWRRDAARRPVIDMLDTHHLSVSPERLPWIRTYNDRPYSGRVLWSDPGAINEFVDELRAVGQIKNDKSRLRDRLDYAWLTLQKQYADAVEAAEYNKFLADYGDPDLWEGHRKTLKLPTVFAESGDLRAAISALVERDTDVVSMSAAEIVERASEATGETVSVPDEISHYVVPIPAPAETTDDADDE